MEKRFNLKNLPTLYSMHDQRVASMELKDKMFILHYKELNHSRNNEFHSCDVVFFGIEEADICAEIRKKNGRNFKGIIYYDDEFLEFIVDNEYRLETIQYYHSYKIVIIQAVLVGKNEEYCEDCTIRISADEIMYKWQ